MGSCKVSVIILNWNGWKDTIECLESLYQINYHNYDIILVDNASSDDSIEKIKEYCEGQLKVYSDFFKYTQDNKPIKIMEITKEESETINIISDEFLNLNFNKKLILIKNDKNYGFAEGNNIGMQFALNSLNSDYILLLNNDTVVDKNFMKELVNCAEKDKSIGITGSKIYYYSDPDRIQSAGARFSWNKGEGKILQTKQIDSKNFEESIKVDYVSGCALLAKSELIKKCGYLDPIYFAYWEEVDFCTRAKTHDYHIVYTPKSKIWHKVSTTSSKISGLYGYYISRNAFIFMRRYGSKKNLLTFLTFFFIYRFWSMCGIFLIYNRNLSDLKYLLKGTLDGIFKINR